MILRKEDGAITVFLSIILLTMIVLAGVIVDAARINIANTQIQRSVETSVRSALAGYNKDLKENYGMFALNVDNEDNLKEIIKEYLSKNLMIDKEYLNEDKIGDYLDFYDYEIESIEVKPLFNLTENPVTRKQILEYMKYRAPKAFLQEFLAKLDMVKKAGSTSEAYKEKMDFEKVLKKISDVQQEIYRDIYGKYESYNQLKWEYKIESAEYYIRKFDKEDLEATIHEYFEVVYRYKNLKKNLKVVNKKIENYALPPKQNNNSSNENKDLLLELLERKRAYEEEINDSYKELKNLYNGLIEGFEEFKDVNLSAAENIDELIDKSIEVRKELDEYKTYLQNNKDNIMEDSLSQLISEAEEYEKQIPYFEEKDNNGLNEIKLEIERNIKSIDGEGSKVLGVIDLVERIAPEKAIEYVVSNLDIDRVGEMEAIKDHVIEKLNYYNNEIQYNYLISEKNEDLKEYDHRKDEESKANNRIKISDDEATQDGKVISDKLHSILPSVIKFNTIDGKFQTEKLINDIEFHQEEEGGFGEAAFIFLGEMTDKLNPVNIRDEIYINEYIMGTFKNSLTISNEEYDLRHNLKSEHDTYFNEAEIEYILNGKKSEKMNQRLTDSKILLTRFCLNSIHVFTCKDKNIFATSIATSVAGWYTGGAGIPIIRTLILLSWSMAESVYDLDTLKDVSKSPEYREIPLYKTEENWKTSIKGLSKTKTKESNEKKASHENRDSLDTNYSDYLRFFLLAQDDEITMKRVQDLIQLNMQKTINNEELRLNKFNTLIKVEVVVSIKYLFLTESFILQNLKLNKNRHGFKVTIYQGY